MDYQITRKAPDLFSGNKLSDYEKSRIVKVLELPEYVDSNLNQIVPKLADHEIYLGSESTMSRILCELKMNNHHRSSLPSKRHSTAPLTTNGPTAT